ncbi:Gustatory receptor 4e [Ladona fulva]|uniref:Gustatory receptor n=1 Tax=Ladona fulva TaxID=123851 RepID=A0A8K0KNV7_LADFU|nr:Gustatory receptor 4e [Ladona fulva]
MSKEDLLWALSPMFTINALTGIPVNRYASPRSKIIAACNFFGYTVLFCFSSSVAFCTAIAAKFYDINMDLAMVVNFFWSAIILFSTSLSGYAHLLRNKQVTDMFLGLSQLQEHSAGIFAVKRIRTLVKIQSVMLIVNTVNLIALAFVSENAKEHYSFFSLHIPLLLFWTTVHLEQEWQFYNVLFLLLGCVRRMNENIRTLLKMETSNPRKEYFTRHLPRLKSILLDSHSIYRSAERIYGVPNVVVGLETLLSLSFLLYSIFDPRIIEYGTKWNVASMCSSLFWMLSGFIIEAFVISANYQLMKEVERTEKLVIDAMLKVEDYPVRRELRLFALQLLHTPFRSSACGFFPLELTLFTSMTATVVTYLVILVQFKGSE